MEGIQYQGESGMDPGSQCAYGQHPHIGRPAERIYVLFQCLSKLPHDSSLTPSVDPSVSLIPPVNASSSYYDGIVQSFSLAFPGVGSSDYVFTQT